MLGHKDIMNGELNLITSLNQAEQNWWRSTIKEFRDRIISEPKAYALEIITSEGITRNQLIQDTERYLEQLREAVWQRYLLDEAKFHREVVSHLIEERDLPRNILTEILKKDFFNTDFSQLTEDDILKKVTKIVGDTTGRIMPYIYELSLSTTQSRRSRAGKVFERIIETFFDIFEYPYSNQSALGNAAYNAQKLGKKVDLIVPDVETYLSNRAKCAVITMKTTLRERWQEVAEELNRTNVPHIYLLTVDESVSSNTADIMHQYNITLVLYKRSKEKTFTKHANVIDYETFFLKEMPYILNYWGQSKK